MIVSGGARCNWRFFASHLLKAEENERVSVVEMRGLAADTVREAFREMDFVAGATRCKNFFYHANINPREDERLTPEQWEQAADTLERNLGLEGHARFIVEHEKDGRIHQHIVWSRIDPETLTAVSDSNNYAKHEETARELEVAFGHEAVKGAHTGLDGARPERRPKNWETFRGHKSGLDPQGVKQEITALWERCDTGQAFRAALEDAGYRLCQGDKRDFVVVDAAGDAHSLARRISGAKAADIRARMGDVDRDSLPTVAEGRALAREALERGEAEPEAVPLSVAVDRLAGQGQQADPEITPELDREFSQRWEGWEPLKRGVEAGAGEIDRGTEEAPVLARGALAAIDGEHAGWRRFVDRVRAFAATARAGAMHFLHDETSGAPEAERGFVARLFDAGVRLFVGIREGEGMELAEGVEQAAELAKDVAAKPEEGASGQSDSDGGDQPRTFVERLRDEAVSLWRNERGSVPDAFDRQAEQWMVAQPPPTEEPSSAAREPDTPAPDISVPDGPDIT